VHLRDPLLLGVYHHRGYALHELGRYQEELQLARDLERRFPGFPIPARTHEAMALAALGELDTLRRRLVEWEATPEPAGQDWAGNRAIIAAQELMAHGNEPEGLKALAAALPLYRRLRTRQGLASEPEINTLEWTGDLDGARRLALAALPRIRSQGESTTFLAALGRIAARQGKRAEALRYDRLLAATGNGAPLLRATIASRLGDREVAVRLLEEARGRGNDLNTSSWSVHRSPDFAGLRDYPPFERFLKPRDRL
jgi:tetratricopeptide (TPR) repeat protein